jgi:hypothetical protein
VDKTVGPDGFATGEHTMNLDVLMAPYAESARDRTDTLDVSPPRHRAELPPAEGEDPRAREVLPRHRAGLFAI